MNPLETYLRELDRIRASGAGTPELSYYSALATLFTTVGEDLDPEVRCIMPLADQGEAGALLGYPTIKKWLSYREERVLGRSLHPEGASAVTNIARRITAIVMMGPALGENYAAVKRAGFEWPPRLAEPSELGFAGILILALAGAYLLRERIAAQVGVRPPTGDPGRAELTLPAGFTDNVFAEELNGPRFMTVGSAGTLFVAERGPDRVVALPDRDGDGQADETVVVAKDLIAPSSLDFRPGTQQLYVGETTRVTRLTLDGLEVTEREVVIDGLPEGGHSTRTVLFGPEGRLYVSIGSSCNVCEEDDSRRAAVMVYDADGSQGRLFARGLRNAVGLAVYSRTDTLWAANNGRDMMGNDRPPETVYELHEGMDAGWPRCHAGDIPDPEFGQSDDACAGVAQPQVEMQAHSAPLGLAFYSADLFPAEYWGDIFIAFHGSWNRVPPTGYKVVRVPMENGQVAGEVEDFATGWLLENWDSLGRPAGVTVAADGALLVSDDKGGFIYRIIPTD